MPDLSNMQPLEIVKITENSYRIEDNGVRAFLFIGTERALLVDAGFGASGSLKELVGSLTDKPLMLVLSHADMDHAAGAREFDCAYMHPSEMANFRGEGKPEIQILPLWERDVIDIGERSFEVVLIPGHTPGSIALLDRENRIIISGDTVSQSPVFMFGAMRCLEAYLFTIKKLISMKTEFDTIYPSHGQFPLPSSILDKTLAATEKMLAGELTGEDPGRPLPAKMFMHDGVGFFCNG